MIPCLRTGKALSSSFISIGVLVSYLIFFSSFPEKVIVAVFFPVNGRPLSGMVSSGFGRVIFLHLACDSCLTEWKLSMDNIMNYSPWRRSQNEWNVYNVQTNNMQSVIMITTIIIIIIITYSLNRFTIITKWPIQNVPPFACSTPRTRIYIYVFFFFVHFINICQQMEEYRVGK